MTPKERQELRENHADASWWDDPGCSCCEGSLIEVCEAGCIGSPCDVIRVLDALEILLKHD